MYLAIIIIFLLIYLYCNNLEGFFNYDECNIRNSFRDKTCPEKWGVPPCNSWQKVPSIKDIEESNVSSSSPSYQMNEYLYDIHFPEDKEEVYGVNTFFFS